MKTNIIAAGKPLPTIASAVIIGARRVKIMWTTGETKVVDLAPALVSRRVYIPLCNDDALFETLRVSEFGDAIEWEGGIDFSAEWLERLTEAASLPSDRPASRLT